MGGAPADPLARRRISSSLTFVQKFVIPVAMLGLGAQAFMFAIENARAPEHPLTWSQLGWFIALALTFFGARFLRFNFPLKAVEIDGDALYVSNYLRQTRIPLGDIERISAGGWFRRGTVTIHLRTDTAFGHRIIFWPTIRWSSLLIAGLLGASHPIVAELRDAISRGA
jgi:hypothetical protein